MLTTLGAGGDSGASIVSLLCRISGGVNLVNRPAELEQLPPGPALDAVAPAGALQQPPLRLRQPASRGMS